MANYSIAHIEIPAVDASEASTFYNEVFGWKIVTNTAHNYVTFQAEDGLRGGFQGPHEKAYQPGRLLVYLATDDIDAALAEIEAHGGKTIVSKTVIPNILEWAIFADPAGNQVGLSRRYNS
ncbi:glyoxalase [Ktedonobacter sp. SOSP1-52]|uniref:VOC family protein n=1 Tax=Ktedonobacter sp. SOSP1-52 TaxID=2778366 RepID=UPI001915852E|nr:VOC family protein [Ktedonobacter sp. SOSP1-52]GHO61910.1 glyoxalase [Ktedonobacter sp. SOSP1-52]